MIQHTEEQPWVPAGLAAKLVVGARVRLRITGECSILSGDGDKEVPHPAEFDGVAGVIRSVHAPTEGHPYNVVFDKNVMTEDGFWYAGDCAAIELIPLEEEASQT